MRTRRQQPQHRALQVDAQNRASMAGGLVEDNALCAYDFACAVGPNQSNMKFAMKEHAVLVSPM